MATVVALGGESVSELRFKSVKLAIGSFVPADDVPTGVDAPGTGKLRDRGNRSWHILHRRRESMESTIGVQICTHELAAHIDRVDLRESGSRDRNIEARTPPFRADEAVLHRGNASIPSADQVSAFIKAVDACVLRNRGNSIQQRCRARVLPSASRMSH